MTNPIILNSAMRMNLLALQGTQHFIDRTTLRLATGLKVSSALGNPQNFFAAQALNYRASDLLRRLDSIEMGFQVIKQASNGVEAIEKLLNQAESIARDRLDALLANGTPLAATSSITPLSSQILAAAPAAYWRLNETAGTTAVNLGSIGASVNGTYSNTPALGAGALYSSGDVSTGFNGINEFVSIPNNAQINTTNQSARSIELVFNANTTAGRQVLYEEGGTTNAFSIYIFNGNVYVTGRDSGSWGPANISAPIVAGETYHIAFTFSSTSNQFTGYLNGELLGSSITSGIFPAHSAAVSIGRMSGGTWFHDGSQNGNGFYFNGSISDVALYNTTLNATEILNHANAVLGTAANETEDKDFNEILSQITYIAKDSHYRGIGLLDSDNLKTLFNESGSSSLLSQGVDFTVDGLNIRRFSFDSIEDIKLILDSIQDARERVRDYGRSLATKLTTLSIRQEFTQNTIKTLNSGRDGLILADMNEEGATLLALQTRQLVSMNVLSFTSRMNSQIIDLFT